MSKRSLINIKLLKAGIRAVHKQFTDDELERFRVSIDPSVESLFNEKDPHISVQNVAKRIVEYLGFSIGPVVVIFDPTISEVGHVDLQAARQLLIVLNQNYFRYGEVAPIKAVAGVNALPSHQNLFRTLPGWLAALIGRAYFNSVFSAVAVDQSDIGKVATAVATYLGLGWLIMNSNAEESWGRDHRSTPNGLEYTSVTKQYGIRSFDADECGFVLAKREEFFGEDPTQFLRDEFSKNALKNGRRIARDEKHQSLVVSPSLKQRVMYWFRRRKASHKLKSQLSNQFKIGNSHFSSKDDEIRVEFECCVCFQAIRVPIRQGSIVVHCPTCNNSLDCVT